MASSGQNDVLRFVAASLEPFELREDEDEAKEAMPTLVGYFARFDEWTEVNSMWEGHFMERIREGTFRKTFAENRSNMRVLFQHGQDPHIGEKVLGPIDGLREETKGAFYEVPLFDTSYNRDLLPGLRSGAYGSSFRFRVLQEEFEKEPEPSEHNPKGIPERTITEAKVMEFGPVTFPAYEGTSAGLRSATDWWHEQSVGEMIRHLADKGGAAALAPGGQPVTVNITGSSSVSEEELAETVRGKLKASRSTPGRDYLKTGEEEPQWRL